MLDASIVVRLLQNQPGDDALRRRLAGEAHYDAPALIDAEVASAIRGMLRTSKPGTHIGPRRAGLMLTDLADLPLTRHSLQPYMRRALAMRDNATAYDAFYLALAEALGEPLLTADRKFGGVPHTSARVEVWD